MSCPEKGLDKKQVAVQSISRAADILSRIGDRVNSMTDIAEKCNLSNSTVHRILKALEDSNLVIQDPVSRKYYFGDLITRIVADIQVPHEYLVTCAKEEMKHLAEVTGETISIAVMIGQQYNTLHEIPSRHKLRVVEAGNNAVEPLSSSGAAAKVLLSQLDDKELKIRLKNIHITDDSFKIDELISQIRSIRLKGYSISHDEVVKGGTCISAPVKNYILPAVLSVFGPKDRMRHEIKKYIDVLCNSAANLSSRLGSTIKAKEKVKSNS
jgi:DNA-binding IclR family transcriptional regulator